MIFPQKRKQKKIELVARPDLVSNFKQKVFVSNLVSNFKRKVFVSKPVSNFFVSFHVKPCVEYYVFESNHVSEFKEKDFKRFPSDLTQKLFTLNLTRDPLEFTKKPGGPKLIPTIFLTADSKTENNPDNIFDS